MEANKIIRKPKTAYPFIIDKPARASVTIWIAAPHIIIVRLPKNLITTNEMIVPISPEM